MTPILRDIWTILQPLILLLVSTVGPMLVAWVAYHLTRLLRIEDEAARVRIEAELSAALHRSAENAIRVAMARLGANATTEQLLREALPYVERNNPDALERFGIDRHGLADILLGKVPSILDAAARR